MKIQLWPFAHVRLLNKPYENEVILRMQNIPLKYCQPLELLMYIGRGLRFFHTGNMGSLDQRAANSLAFKVGGLKKSLPLGPGPSRTSRPMFYSDLVEIILKV